MRRNPTPKSLILAIGALAAGLTGLAAADTTIQAPALAAWNDQNARTVDPDSDDGRTYLYPDALTRDSDTAGDGTGSRAYIHWRLDTNLGEPPGIQVVTNDMQFPRRNCIMATGIDPTSGVDKTCSDPQGSAKRFWLTLTEGDVPVDLVFDTGTDDLVYEDPIDPGAEGFEVGRIYRVIQKYANHTGRRIQGFRMELGFGTGDDFVPADFATDAIAFEMRTSVPREFFGQADERSREVWAPDDYASFSPKMFDVEAGGRFPGIPGYFDDAIAGLAPPQDFEDNADEKSQFIASGDDVDGATGIVGPTTPNYFDIPSFQGAGAGLTGNVFGYLLPSSLAPPAIYEDDDGDPATEGDLVAWWDGSDWRYGNEEGFAVVPDSQLRQWAKRPLSEDEVLEPPRYEIAPLDDVTALNVDTFIYIGEDFDPASHPTLTLRYTATTVDANTIAGTEDPAWTQPGNEAPLLSSYLPDDDGGSSSGCSYNPRAAFDPTVLVLLAVSLIGLRRRNRARASI